MLLAMAALAGLTFYVYNAGQQINRRVEMQNAADAVAASGAVWMARSMNTVAMNNIAQARMLALVPVMDALPLAGEMAFSELDAWIGDAAYNTGTVRTVQGLTAFLGGMGTGGGDLAQDEKDKIRTGVESLLERLKYQRSIIAPLRDLAGPIEKATTWSIRGMGGPPPHGQFWRTAMVMDEYSQAVVASAGVLAQANAVRYGRENKADAAFVVPVSPELPGERGSFNDFSYALRSRLRVDLESAAAWLDRAADVGGAVPNFAWPQSLGPWARFFSRPQWSSYHSDPVGPRGWRHEWGVSTWIPYGTTTTIVIPPREGRQIIGPSAGGGRAGGEAVRGQGSRAGQVIERPDGRTETKVKGYTTFGPYYWANRWITDFVNREFRKVTRSGQGDTSFLEYYAKNAQTKLGYMFSGPNPPLEKMHYPQWWTDLAAARKIAEDPANRVRLTRYYYRDVIYKIVSGAKSITSDNLSNPVTKEFSGWVAPEDLRRVVFGGNPEVSESEQVGTLPMWKFTAEGVERRFTPQGEVIEEWPVEFVWYFIFAGIDAGGEAVITNPCNWDSSDILPAPWVLTAEACSAYTPDPDFADETRTQLGPRRNNFAFLGVVRKEVRSPFWPQMFSSGNPIGSIVAVAQAKLLNNQSWDLWTQDWQAQLTSIRGWDQWVDRMDAGVDDAALSGGMVLGEEVERIRDYMWNLGGDTAEDYLTH
jgi:hypothetical protein